MNRRLLVVSVILAVAVGSLLSAQDGIIPGFTQTEEQALAQRRAPMSWPQKEKLGAFLVSLSADQLGLPAPRRVAYPGSKEQERLEKVAASKAHNAESALNTLRRFRYVMVRSRGDGGVPPDRGNERHTEQQAAQWERVQLEVGVNSRYDEGEVVRAPFGEHLEIGGQPAYVFGATGSDLPPLDFLGDSQALPVTAIVRWVREPWHISVMVVRFLATRDAEQARATWENVARTKAIALAKRLDAALGKSVPSPILFLPGVGGTELFWRDSPAEKAEIWPVGLLNDQMRLLDYRQQQADGSGVKHGNLLREHREKANFYGSFLSFLETQGFREGHHLATFPYDWRLPNAEHFDELDVAIGILLSETRAKKVSLIAHSMGGLIARAYALSTPARKARIETLITIGTPYAGATKPYRALADGYDFGNPRARTALMKIVAQVMPAAYELLPRYRFVVRDKEWLTLQETWRIRYKPIKTYWQLTRSDLTNIYAPLTDFGEDNEWSPRRELLKRADAFYEPMGSISSPTTLTGAPDRIAHYVIAGTGFMTLRTYVVRERWFPSLGGVELNDGTIAWLQPYFSDGDGTVPLESARLVRIDDRAAATANYHVKLSEHAHGEMTMDATVQKIVGQILAGKPPPESQYPPPTGSIRGRHLQWSERIDFRLGSDATLRIVDVTSGRFMGFDDDGGVHEHLDGGSFEISGGVEVAAIPDPTKTYGAEVRGIRDGKFTLTVGITRAGKVSEFQYADVAVREGTLAKVKVPAQLDTHALPILVVETDGKARVVAAKLLRENVEAEPDPVPPGEAVSAPPTVTAPPTVVDEATPSGFGAKLEASTAESAKRLGVMYTPGVLVTEVEGDTPAKRAGLQVGDIILYAGDKMVVGPDELNAVLDARKASPGVKLKILRDHRMHELDLVLSSRRQHP